MPTCEFITSDCPGRQLFDQISDKWSMLVLFVLDERPKRFNAIKRELGGITQKALTQCLRRLERNGLIIRHVIDSSPIAVEYEISALGRSLQVAFRPLFEWTITSVDEVEISRTKFDNR